MSSKNLQRRIQTQEGLITMFLDADGLHLLDQRALPGSETWLLLTNIEAVAEAIESLAVRGAPAIGGCAALALAHVARCNTERSVDGLRTVLKDAAARLGTTRPTAVNLFYAIDKVLAAARAADDESNAIARATVDAAEAVCEEDAAACAAMGAHGAELFQDGDRVLTICHTGSLATCGAGTALGVLKAAAAQKDIEVFALETRPLLQGARLTVWECLQVGLKVTLITDGMAAFALAKKGITKAIAGADRIAANGDVANKIGTYGLATLCRAHGAIPFYVAAPSTTFDLSLKTGEEIPIEERDADEIRRPRGTPFAPAECAVWNPAFDVTPHHLLAGIITEGGLWSAPFDVDARDALLKPREK